MMRIKTTTVLIAFFLPVLSGCGTLRHANRSGTTASLSGTNSVTGSSEKMLFSENSQTEDLYGNNTDTPDGKRDDTNEDNNHISRTFSDRFDIYFSGSESEHVRIPAGVTRIPEEGFVLSLDGLRNEFCYPYKGKFISDYGMRSRAFHTGIDIKAAAGDTIRAVLPGVVRMSKLYSGYGNIVVIRHYCGLETVYSHGSRNLVKVNDKVEAGTPVALAGRSGNATTEHLHFEVRVAGEHIDPKLLLDCEKMDLQQGNLYFKSSGGIVVAGRREDETNRALQLAMQEKTRVTAERTAGVTQSTAPSDPVYHQVRQGDTLSAIARKYSTTVKQLCSLNGIMDTQILKINQRLRIK